MGTRRWPLEPRVFVGREAPLRSLRAFFDRPDRSRITAIYGRRRVGKTRLVKEAYRDHTLLHFEGLESAGSAQQRRHFRDTLYRHTRLESHRIASTNDWSDLLLLLAEYLEKKTCVVFLDEFQWLAAGRNELVSKLKVVWDNHIAEKAHVHLILCGSISSFLVNKVIRSRALYGRIDEVIDLGPLTLSEARAGFFARRSAREALEYYLAFGGVPKYLELFDDRQSTMLNIQRLCFQPGAYFVDEFDRIFISHFGRDRLYRKIVEFLSDRRFASRKQIARHLEIESGGRLTGLLEDLCLASFVERYGSVHSPASTALTRYRLADPLLRFHSRFIRPLKGRIARTTEGIPIHQALPKGRYEDFLGLAFEQFCFQHAEQIARRLGFSAVAFDYGSWFQRDDQGSGAQIDLLFKRADRVITLCEVKFRERVGLEVVAEVEQKVTALSKHWSHAIEKVLISALPPSPELETEGYFAHVLTADDL
ncbi:MAG: ATP-binding protein [Planctomycetota bacterium]